MCFACQVWKANVLPLLQPHIAERVDSMTTYMLIQHEAAVANLLEVNIMIASFSKATLHSLAMQSTHMTQVYMQHVWPNKPLLVCTIHCDAFRLHCIIKKPAKQLMRTHYWSCATGATGSCYPSTVKPTNKAQDKVALHVPCSWPHKAPRPELFYLRVALSLLRTVLLCIGMCLLHNVVLCITICLLRTVLRTGMCWLHRNSSNLHVKVSTDLSFAPIACVDVQTSGVCMNG